MHSTQPSYLAALARAVACTSNTGQATANVLQHLQDVNAVQASEDREKLWGIIKVVEFGGRQNKPLRGHRESSFTLDLNQAFEENPGNFLALVRFRFEARDSSLSKGFSSRAKERQSESHVRYRSHPE